IEGAKSVLVNLSGSDNLTLQEYQDVVELVTEKCSDDALIIAGQAFNPELGDRIKVTVVATGFERKEEVVGSELADMELVKRRMGSTVKSNEEVASKKGEEADKSAAAIEVNRWQDLQKQLGKGPAANTNDYSIPAVLRYSRNTNDEK
ncbi:MAG: cell division protein FtsZ, partial [Spirochaetia bacterium]|nr:cell division protein FtsZ [Spirochaetia bacterium]